MPASSGFAALTALLLAASPDFAQPADTRDAYRNQARAELERLKGDAPIISKARTIVLFIGDGMCVSTLTAADLFSLKHAQGLLRSGPWAMQTPNVRG